MSRHRPARTIPDSDEFKSLVKKLYKQEKPPLFGGRKYNYKCTHCVNVHQGFIRELTEMWAHIKSKPHQRRCPDDKVRFATWLPVSSSQESSELNSGSLAAAEEAVEEAEEDADAAVDPQVEGDEHEDPPDEYDEGIAIQDENDEGEEGEENGSDDSSSTKTRQARAASPGREVPPTGLVALAAAAEAAEENDKAPDLSAAAINDADTAEAAHENECAPDLSTAPTVPAEDALAPAVEEPAVEHADDVAPAAQEHPVAPPVKLTKERKTETILEFIDTIIAEDPEFVKLRIKRKEASLRDSCVAAAQKRAPYSKSAGWCLEWNTLTDMFENWLETQNIHKWSFAQELSKTLDGDKSDKVQCNRIPDKPRQRLLQKKV